MKIKIGHILVLLALFIFWKLEMQSWFIAIIALHATSIVTELVMIEYYKQDALFEIAQITGEGENFLRSKVDNNIILLSMLVAILCIEIYAIYLLITQILF